MDPFDLKTLAQFNLLGDPSVHPVAAPSAGNIPRGVATAEAERFFRAERRNKLRLTGTFLAESKPTASKRVATGRLSATARAALSNIARLAGLGAKQVFKTFAVKGAPPSKRRGPKTATAPSRYHITIGTPKKAKADKIKRGVAVVAKELNGRIVGYRIYYQK
jgi:hypothetical protein